MTESVTQCHDVTAASTYYAKGVVGGEEGKRKNKWQSCLQVMLTAGPGDDRKAPWEDGAPRNSFLLQMHSL